MTTMNWSKYQEKIFEAVESSNASLIIEAVAGSGKTTTLVEIMNRLPAGERACFVAFNKAIALTLAGKVSNPNARCMTLHAVGWSAWRTSLAWDAGNCLIAGGKVRDIYNERTKTWSWPEKIKYGPGTVKLISLAKGCGIVPSSSSSSSGSGSGYVGLVDDLDENWEALMELHNLDPLTCKLDLAREILAESILKGREVCDFEDQLYMPVVAGVPFEQYDVVMLDEAQDVNSLQIEMVSRMVKGDGRLIAVGDRNQAIYGFRGALADCLDLIAERFDCQHLPLSISYRCPRSVVRHAQGWVKQIEFAPEAEEGVLEFFTPEDYRPWKASSFQKDDVILCRLNRPLVSLAFSLLRKRVPCKIAGRDIGKGLVDLVKQLKASTISELEDKLGEWRKSQIRRAKGEESKIAGINDRADTLYVFMEHHLHDDSVADLVKEIEGMFVDVTEPGKAQSILMLSTIHKAKGGEWERVFVLDAGEFMPIPWAKEGWEMQQERNLMYVAATRAKRELRYIVSEGVV